MVSGAPGREMPRFEPTVRSAQPVKLAVDAPPRPFSDGPFQFRGATSLNKSCTRNPNTEKSHVISEGYGALFFCEDFYFDKIEDLAGRFKTSLNHLLTAIVLKMMYFRFLAESRHARDR